MALELLHDGECVPVVDRVRVTTGQPAVSPTAPDLGASYAMLIEGRGILTGGSGRRYVVQPDGAFAQLGVGRFAIPGQQGVPVLCGLGGRRWYAEYELHPWFATAVTTRRAHALSPVTLQGFEDVAPAPPDPPPSSAALLPDGTWMTSALSELGQPAVKHLIGGAWQVQVLLPFGGGYLSWGDGDTIWICSQSGEGIAYDFHARTLGPRVRIADASNIGLFYWRKHRVFISLHASAGARSVRVWAATPRPHHIEQTVTPAPTAGRVSRVTTRLLGSFGEACADERVRWTVSSGYQVVPLQTVTDANGYAYADLIVPMGMTGSGDVVAEVVV